ncbi:MAG: gamma-glutamyl-gamma-aminobutyrate hydrolase family protein [Chloroflexi bacterium]|nr:gamma-glutamyl-gamma-aminobutyrate hydrolase family protein [Chloroflexota bacterium]
MSAPLIGSPAFARFSTWGDGTRDMDLVGMPTYNRALVQNGGALLFIPLDLSGDALRGIYDKLDGLLLTGGVDVHPNEYGEAMETFCGEIDPLRDAAELKIARWALAERKPILAICRGVQVLNVAAGGTLYQDVEAQYPDPIPHRRLVNGEPENAPHPIAIVEGSRLARALGGATATVNSGHHQAVKAIGAGLHATAQAADRLTEAIEATDPGVFVLGMQFHPEQLLDEQPPMHGIFRAFVSACR